jgi:tetratricopeptide (TPR) repeat protein
MPQPRSREAKVAEDAVEQLRHAVEIGAELVASYSMVPDYKASLARSEVRLGEALRQAGALPEAAAHLAKGVDLQKSLAAEFPSVLGYRFLLLQSLHHLSEVERARHEPAKARASLEEAIATAQSIKEPESSRRMPPVRRMLAMEYAALAKVLKELGQDALADEAAAKAGQYNDHHRPAPSAGPATPK